MGSIVAGPSWRLCVCVCMRVCLFACLFACVCVLSCFCLVSKANDGQSLRAARVFSSVTGASEMLHVLFDISIGQRAKARETETEPESNGKLPP